MWLTLDSLEAYEETTKKLRTLAPTWEKRPLSSGNGIGLVANIGNVKVEVNVEFLADKVISIMSKILNCEIQEVKTEHKAYTTVSYACAKKETTQK